MKTGWVLLLVGFFRVCFGGSSLVFKLEFVLGWRDVSWTCHSCGENKKQNNNTKNTSDQSPLGRVHVKFRGVVD